MKVADALRFSKLDPADLRAAFVGSGGKSTLLFQTARDLNPPVIVTTSTHLGDWQSVFSDNHLIFENYPQSFDPDMAVDGVTLMTGGLEGNRYKGLDPQFLRELYRISNRNSYPILVEADGSRQRPIKAPAEHEPAIPEWVNQVIVVVGLLGLGKKIEPDVVHRPQRYADLLKLPMGSIITEDCLVQTLLHPNGGMSKIPDGVQTSVVLNQADNSDLIAAGRRIASRLIKGKQGGKYDRAIITSFTPEIAGKGNVHGVIEPVAGIVLAGGESTRFGSPKIMIDWHGRPLIRHIVEVGLAGGLWPMIVVLGPVTTPAVEVLKDLPVQILLNHNWAEGQSTSLKAGLKTLQGNSTGAAVFLLADQPFISEELIAAMCQEHAASLAPVIAPFVNGQRSTPTLFDQVTFNDLLQIQGDVGGRAIFQKYPPQYIQWPDARLRIDLDTQQDYNNATRG